VTCPTGFVTDADIVLEVTDSTYVNRWQLSTASGFDSTPQGTWGDSLTITHPIDDTTGKTFYVRCKAVDGETAQVDTSVTLEIETPNSAVVPDE